GAKPRCPFGQMMRSDRTPENPFATKAIITERFVDECIADGIRLPLRTCSSRSTSMRVSLVRMILCAAVCVGWTTIAGAQEALPKLIRIVVPFAAGGSNDVIARALTGPLAKRLDASVIVENKPGAAGVIGADYVAKAPRDGSVLLLTSSSF